LIEAGDELVEERVPLGEVFVGEAAEGLFELAPVGFGFSEDQVGLVIGIVGLGHYKIK
jgi:hypothetical protein